MLARSCTVSPSAADGRLVAVGGELVLEVDELALQLAIGAFGFAVGIDDDVARRVPSTTMRSPVFDLLENAPHAGDGGNAAAAGEDRGVAGLAAGLRDDAHHGSIAEGYDMRREQFVGDDDERAGKRFAVGLQDFGQVAADAQDDVAQVVEPQLRGIRPACGRTSKRTRSSSGGAPTEPFRDARRSRPAFSSRTRGLRGWRDGWRRWRLRAGRPGGRLFA